MAAFVLACWHFHPPLPVLSSEIMIYLLLLAGQLGVLWSAPASLLVFSVDLEGGSVKNWPRLCGQLPWQRFTTFRRRSPVSPPVSAPDNVGLGCFSIFSPLHSLTKASFVAPPVILNALWRWRGFPCSSCNGQESDRLQSAGLYSPLPLHPPSQPSVPGHHQGQWLLLMFLLLLFF